MKKKYLAILLFPLLITGCSSISNSSYSKYSVEGERKSGEIGEFDLTGPQNGFNTDSGFTFTWEEASNAEYYQLELASTNEFISNDEDEIYVKESNLSSNKYVLNFNLPTKGINYFWKVTAFNKDHTKKSKSVNNFFFASKKIEEIPIKIEDEQDWTVHKEGSQATVSIDRTNFFNNNENSLAIVFDKEQTNSGKPDSDGWIVITKNEDKELYGTDSFYLNFYYSGHDANVLIRVLDDDGEYWHKQIQISNNAKQTVLLRYDEFELRTVGTNIYNRKFDWQHIRYFEIVFERTFGDGVCLISNIKAVKYENYQQMFIKKMNFNDTDNKEWTYENFDFEKIISEDGSELTLSYKAKNTETNPNGFSGYGFQNVNVYKFFSQGDAIRMNVKYTGSSSNSVFYFRILEEDNDRWQFKLSFSYLIKDDYKEIIIPFKAFQRTDYMNGDGSKQFYYIQKFNIGLADNYSTGTLSIKDLEIIKIDDVVSNRTRVVNSDGCIDNFDSYNLYTEMYYYWEPSVNNKDESIMLDNIHKAGNNSNLYCAEFDYKSDMEQAVYQIYLDTSSLTDKYSLSLWLKDASNKSDDSMFSYLNEEDVAAEMTIQLTLDTGEWYRYTIMKVNKEWNNYTIAFKDFELINASSLFDNPKPLDCSHIIHMAFGFKYLYYDKVGSHYPVYTSANPVYVDEIYFKSNVETSITEITGNIKEDEEDNNKITIDTFEDYSDDNSIFDNWSYGYNKDYNGLYLANDVSSIGGTKSIRMHYKGTDSVSYIRNTQFASSVTAKGFSIDIKGDDKATIYINLNWRVGTSLLKMRCSLNNVSSSWSHYEIGFELFKDANGSNKTITMSSARNIESISFGIVNNSYTESDIYIDNIRLLKNISYSTNTKTLID